MNRVDTPLTKDLEIDTKDIISKKSDELTNRRKQRLAKRRNNVNFDSMQSSELKQYASDKLKTEFVDLSGVGDDVLRETIKVMDSFEKKTNGNTIDGLKIQFGGVPKGVYAKYDDRRNTLILPKKVDVEKFKNQ